MKLIKWLFRFTGLGQIELFVKIVLNLIVLALIIVLFFLIRSGFMQTWHFIAKNEPQTKEKIETLYNDYLLKDDSLKTAKKQVLQLNHEYNVCDTNLYNSDQKIKSLELQIIQHQKNNLALKKENKEFKEFGACFEPYKIRIKEGFLNYRTETRWRNVKCDSLKFE